jgi:predicted metalloprotease
MKSGVLSRGESTCRRGVPVLAAVALVAGGACAQEVDGNPLVAADGPLGPDLPGEAPETPREIGEVIQAALIDIEAYWQETFPDVYGEEFEPLQGGYHPYGPDSPTPPCGSPPPSYDEIANNAFYCPEDDLIAWDQATLMPDLAEEFGPFTVGIVLAHEFGHAIQPRANVPPDMPTLLFENQADCFAGAWTHWIAEGNSDRFAVDEETLDAAIAGLVSFADLPGTSGQDPMAHGAAFDRVGAFQEGWEQGPNRCAEYPDDPPPSVEIPFSDPEEEASGGNLPLEDEPGNPGLLTRVEQNLNVYYDLLFQDLGPDWTPVEDLIVSDGSEDVTCDGETLSDAELEYASLYCEQENVVVLDGEQLVPALEELGDFAVGAEIGRLYSRAAQLQLGVAGENQDASLQADCLTGVWAEANFPTESGSSPLIDRVGDAEEVGDIMLSPGDLDEAIIGFLTYGETLQEDIGTAFERTDALRAGFLDGLEGCQEYGSLGG